MLLFRLTVANVKMIVRNRQALFWALAFPVVMLGIFGLVGGFRSSTVTIGVVDYAVDALSDRLIGSLSDMPEFEVEIRDDEEAAREEVRDGDLGYLLLIPEGLETLAQSGPPVSLTLVYDEGLLGRIGRCGDRTLPGPDKPGAGGRIRAAQAQAGRNSLRRPEIY